jgi:hypothetical protein
VTSAHYHLIAFVTLHFVGLVLTIGAGFVLAAWLTARENFRRPSNRFRRELNATFTVSATLIASLLLGMSLYGIELLTASPAYGELLEAYLFNHWLAVIPPAYTAFLRHEYVEEWIGGFGTRVAQ